jgi:hypothetical protein
MMSHEDVTQDLKNRALPTFGTNQERKDRLKKFYGKSDDKFSIAL